jgi:hypothetical protein
MEERKKIFAAFIHQYSTTPLLHNSMLLMHLALRASLHECGDWLPQCFSDAV